MIYVSSSAARYKTIGEAVRTLADEGYKNIELSGGTNWYPEWRTDLDKLRREYELNYLVHNYFPPPKDHFILNLSSLDPIVRQRSIDHIKQCIELSSQLGGAHYAFHAGFLVEFRLEEFGRALGTKRKLTKKQQAFDLFFSAFNEVELIARQKGVKLYVENNVYSDANYSVYGNDVPLMLCTADDYNETLEHGSFNLLLDLAHLKVSSKSLGRDFAQQANTLLPIITYLHLSDNDGLSDTGGGIEKKSEIAALLENHDLSDKVITLEVKDSLESVRKTFELVSSLI